MTDDKHPLRLLTSAVTLMALPAFAACGGGAGSDAKGWNTPVFIETDNAGGAEGPQVAFDASGNGLAIWSQSDGTRYSIWSNAYTGWAAPQLIETDDAGVAEEPQIAFDADGNAMAVWIQSDGERYNVVANRYTPGAGWGTAALVETDNAGDASTPQVAVDPSNSTFLAVWEQDNGSVSNIWSNRYLVDPTGGGGWATAELIEHDDTGSAYGPQLAVDLNGNAFAVWHGWDGTRTNIWANRHTTNIATWGVPTLIETTDIGNAYYAQIAFDAVGNALAVWYQRDGMRQDIWSNRYDAIAGWGTAERIESEDAGDATMPQIGFDASGNALAVW